MCMTFLSHVRPLSQSTCPRHAPRVEVLTDTHLPAINAYIHVIYLNILGCHILGFHFELKHQTKHMYYDQKQVKVMMIKSQGHTTL